MAKLLCSWSSGKDAAWALQQVLDDGEHEVAALLTTVTIPHDRVSMHGVRRELLRRQADTLGLELVEVGIPAPCPNEVYEERMREALEPWLDRGLRGVVFGDLFLEDVRRYREERLAPVGLEGFFPLWGRPTGELAEEMLEAGLRARLSCVDLRVLPLGFSGRVWDRSLLEELPDGVDPCGENGEFHSFVQWMPAFGAAIEVELGERVDREGFGFADMVPCQD